MSAPEEFICETCGARLTRGVGPWEHEDGAVALNCADRRGDEPIVALRTVTFTMKVRVPLGFDTGRVTDDDQEDGATPRLLVDHLAGYMGAALDGLRSGRHYPRLGPITETP